MTKQVKKVIGYVLLSGMIYTCWQLWSIHSFGHQLHSKKADCAIVLGAAAWHKKPSPVLKERVNHAVSLYHKGQVDKLLFTGGFGKGAPFSESEVARDYAIEQGVAKNEIFIETKSLATSENLAEAAEIMKTRQFKTALIVSDPWHLKRACAMAKDLGIQAIPSATPTTKYRSFSAKSKFLVREFYYLHLYHLLGK